MSRQTHDKTKSTGPQHPAREEKKVYATRHFDKTNEDAMNIAEARIPLLCTL